jgi:hypothetical protein
MKFRAATMEDCALLAQMNHELIRDEGHRNRMDISELDLRNCSGENMNATRYATLCLQDHAR